jgi:hypothetical protein
MDSKLPMRHRTGQSHDNIAAVSESVAESPGTSIHHHSQQLDIPRSTMQQSLIKDLRLHAYKIQLMQELKPTDHVQRREFVNWVLGGGEWMAIFRSKSSLLTGRTFKLVGA